MDWLEFGQMMLHELRLSCWLLTYLYLCLSWLTQKNRCAHLKNDLFNSINRSAIVYYRDYLFHVAEKKHQSFLDLSWVCSPKEIHTMIYAKLLVFPLCTMMVMVWLLVGWHEPRIIGQGIAMVPVLWWLIVFPSWFCRSSEGDAAGFSCSCHDNKFCKCYSSGHCCNSGSCWYCQSSTGNRC